jgi:MOSC domain-containing protein YiiM
MTTTGTIVALCVSEKKGTAKRAVPAVTLESERGIVGDAHAGPGHRQLSALPAESIERMRRKLPDLTDGAFGENLVTEGIEWQTLPVGSRLRLGRSVLAEITQHGKQCHTRCAIYYSAGECIMPSEGVFMRVLDDGDLRPGDPICLLSSPG